jgi:hypothetical protein
VTRSDLEILWTYLRIFGNPVDTAVKISNQEFCGFNREEKKSGNSVDIAVERRDQ